MCLCFGFGSVGGVGVRGVDGRLGTGSGRVGVVLCLSVL